MRPGVHTQAIVIDRGVAIVADGTGPVVIAPRVEIHGLSFSRDVVLSGLELLGGFSTLDCDGLITLQECSTPEPPPHEIWPGVNYDLYGDCNIGQSLHEVVGCRGVTLVDCEFHGAAGRGGDLGTYDGYPGHHALAVEDSAVALYGCTLVGGDGGAGWAGHFVVYAGAGGNGLHLRDAGSSARTVDLAATGGARGEQDPNSHPNGGVVPGCAGQPVVAVDPNSVLPATHPSLTLDAPRILRGGFARHIAVHGEPGTVVVLIASGEPIWRAFPASVGILHVANPLQITALGTLPASGNLTWPLGYPSPSAFDDFTGAQLQVVGFAGGTRYLSEPRQLIVLDPAY